jgi:alpha 1,2-mannosyltransferase
VQQRRSAWQAALAAVPRYPQGTFSGRGIIIVAGGKYLQPALVMLRMLRDLGCSLRIQIWHLGQEEMTDDHRAMLEPFNVETRDFREYASEEQLRPIAANVGMRLFQLKPLALLHTDLQEVLLLDSDNCPVSDPSYLFEDAHYVATGTLFWPDYWKTSRENPIWDIVGVTPDDSWEQESGQLLVNKARAWPAIGLCVHFNQEFYMQLLNGDKDTFRFAWLAAQTPFYMVNVEPTPVGTLKELHNADAQGFCSHTMLQHDPSGTPLFVHHNQLKNTHLPLGENFRFKKTPGTVSQRYRTQPVSGLALPDGSRLACNDVIGEGFPLIDEDDSTVTPAGLGDFEVNYFSAANSVPRGAFSDFARRGEPLADAARVEIRSRRNTGENVTANCDVGLFELTPTKCELITVCGADQTTIAAPTATSDRVCESNTIDFVRTFEVQVSGSAYAVRVQGTNNFRSSGRVTISRGALYEFQLIGVPAAAPVVLERTGGVIFNDGVTNNIASGNDLIGLDTAPAATAGISTLLYADNNDAIVGGPISLVDPSYSKTYVGKRIFFSGPDFERFNTAYNTDVRVFSESAPGTTSQDFRDIRTSCFATCSLRSDCLGVHIFTVEQGTFCYGLSDLGEVTETEIDSQSWTKTVTATVEAA